MTNPTSATSSGDGPVRILDDRMRPLVVPGAGVVHLGGGAGWAEGPVWLDDVGELWFSDIIGNRVLSYATSTGEVTVAVEGPGVGVPPPPQALRANAPIRSATLAFRGALSDVKSIPSHRAPAGTRQGGILPGAYNPRDAQP